MNTELSTHKSNPTNVNLWVDLGIFAIILLALAPRFTGMTLHEWLGIGVGVGIAVHLLLHWHWIVTVIRRFFGQLPMQSRINLILNTVLFIDMVVVIFTGLMISREVLPLFGFGVQGGSQWRGLHGLSANLIVALTGLHVAVHWKWILNSVKYYLVNPILRLGHNAPQRKPAPVASVVPMEMKQ